MEVALSLTTAERIVVAGRGAKPMGMGSAPDLKGRASSPAPGITDSRWLEFTPGRAGTPTRGTGRRGSAMVWGSRRRDTGCTKESGLMASKGDMARVLILAVEQSMKERGIMDFKMDMAQRPMLMEVRYSFLSCFPPSMVMYFTLTVE